MLTVQRLRRGLASAPPRLPEVPRGALSRSVIETLREHVPPSVVREHWLRRLRERPAERAQMIARLTAPPAAQEADGGARGSAISFACDVVGSHLVQHCLELGTPAERAALGRVLAPAALTLAEHKYGSFVLRACVARAGAEARRVAIDAIVPHVLRLARTEPGAHSVRACLEAARPPQREALVSALLRGEREPRPRAEAGALAALAREKGGSFVAQRSLELAGEGQRAQLLDALLPRALALAGHTEGSFVVRTALQVASGARRGAWLAALMPHAEQLCASQPGLHTLHACALVSDAADAWLARATGCLSQRELRARLQAFADEQRAGARGAEGGARAEALLEFPAGSLDAAARASAHQLATELGLRSRSVGEGDARRLVVWRARAADAPPAAGAAEAAAPADGRGHAGASGRGDAPLYRTPAQQEDDLLSAMMVARA